MRVSRVGVCVFFCTLKYVGNLHIVSVLLAPSITGMKMSNGKNICDNLLHFAGMAASFSLLFIKEEFYYRML